MGEPLLTETGQGTKRPPVAALVAELQTAWAAHARLAPVGPLSRAAPNTGASNVRRKARPPASPALPASPARPAAKPPVNCAACGDTGWVRVAPIGADGSWQARIERCGCQQRADADAAYARARDASNLTPDIAEAQTFATFDRASEPHAFDALRAFAAAPQGWVMLAGASGCGKSHLLVAAAATLLAAGRRPLYAIAPELLSYVRNGIASGQQGDSMDTRIDQARDADVLLLDDLGSERNTEWSDELFYRVLNERYRQQRPTVIASNLAPTDLPSRLASRVRDVALSRVLIMRGVDYRQTLGKRKRVAG